MDNRFLFHVATEFLKLFGELLILFVGITSVHIACAGQKLDHVAGTQPRDMSLSVIIGPVLDKLGFVKEFKLTQTGGGCGCSKTCCPTC